MYLKLTNLHADWPFPRLFNPHCAEVADESIRWIESYRLFSPKHQASFRGIHTGILAALSYPNHSKDHLRIACDLNNLLFALDDVSDLMDGEKADELTKRIIHSLKYEKSGGQDSLLQMHHDYWNTLTEVVNPSIARRFLKDLQQYLEATAREAGDRESHIIKSSLDEYLALRRYTSAVKPCFDMILLPLSIPVRILEDPRVVRLIYIAVDMIAVANDILSFNVEQARGDIHNAVIVIMHSKRLGPQEALDWLTEWYSGMAKDFLRCMKDIPVVENPAVQEDLRKYIWGLGNWVTANYEWSFESHRFWTNMHVTEEMKQNHEIVMELIPRVSEMKAVTAF